MICEVYPAGELSGFELLVFGIKNFQSDIQ
jgi:hypothetical protein